MMRKRLTTILLGGGAVALAVGLSTTAAMAANTAPKATWTVTPGGAVTGTAGKTTLTDKTTHNTLSCASSTTAATLKHGSGQTNPLGEITSVKFNTCTGPGGLTFTATTSASSTNPWPLNGSTFSSGVTHGNIKNIKATLSGPGCSATVGGTTSTSTGTVTGTYTNSTHILKVSGGGNLHVWNVSGCFGLINSGDAAGFTGAYTISPAQTITSP